MSKPIKIPTKNIQDKTRQNNNKNNKYQSHSCPNFVFYDNKQSNSYTELLNEPFKNRIGLSWKMNYKISPQNILIGSLATENQHYYDLNKESIINQKTMRKKGVSLGSLDYSSTSDNDDNDDNDDNEHENMFKLDEFDNETYNKSYNESYNVTNKYFENDDDNETFPFNLQTFMNVAEELLRIQNENE